jgi:hypothetical protein
MKKAFALFPVYVVPGQKGQPERVWIILIDSDGRKLPGLTPQDFNFSRVDGNGPENASPENGTRSAIHDDFHLERYRTSFRKSGAVKEPSAADGLRIGQQPGAESFQFG